MSDEHSITEEIFQVPDFNLRETLLIIGSSLLLVLAVLCAMAFDQSLAQYKVGGIEVSRGIEAETLEQRLDQHAQQYRLTVQKADKSSKTFPLEATGIKVQASESAKAALAAKRAGNLWQKLQWWQQREVPLKLKTNNEVFNNFVNAELTQVSSPAKNAELIIENGQTRLTDETTGRAALVPKAKASLLITAKFLKPQPLVQKDTVLKPAITQTDLLDSQTKLDNVLSKSVVFNMNGRAITAKPVDIAKWLELTPDEAKKTVEINVNSGAVVSYIDTISKPNIIVTRDAVVAEQDGASVTLIQGRAGSDVVNKAEVATNITKNLLANQSINETLNVKNIEYKTVNAAAADKWLLVDVASKRMYALEKTNIVNTFLISAGAPSTPTVTGSYKIYRKVAKQDMRGPNADGTRYFQPDVQWVNYFYRDYAVHGNYWRPASYFGRINSSHGCVGVPNAGAEWIYSWGDIGTPVVVYN